MDSILDDITLTADQQSALEAFNAFLLDPIETVFVLSGYSGCGKSTLVRHLLELIPNFIKMAKLLNPKQQDYDIELTATTNKAAENLSRITSREVNTIHSYLGLKVQTNYRTGETKLIPRNSLPRENVLLFIDEASYVDKQLLSYIFKLTRNCKIVFIGDPAQLTPVKSQGTPVFDAKFQGAALTQVVRQTKGNPIVDLSTMFRHTVNTGEFFQFKPDGYHIQPLSRQDFNQAILDEFTRPNWRYLDSKILAWTNKCVIGYNNFVRQYANGDPQFQPGDYAICNSFVTIGKTSIKTDEMVRISAIEHGVERAGVKGKLFVLNHDTTAFMPDSLEAKNARMKLARANDEISVLAQIESAWIDLRAAYACTINKSQGSTFDSVFIDLDDVRRCNSGDQIARMLYVAVSRARNHVFFTGDLA